MKTGGWSSLVRQRGWEHLFPPRRNAWDIIGRFAEPGTGRRLRGKGEILTGIHDSNANWLRYLAGQGERFTLLSTGTFVIGFDSGADLSGLDPASDNFSFNDIFGKPIACGRFYGGYEFDKLLAGAPAAGASAEGLDAIISSGIFALPAFSDTGGPVAGRGNRGRIIGETGATLSSERASPPSTMHSWSTGCLMACARDQTSSSTAGRTQ